MRHTKQFPRRAAALLLAFLLVLPTAYAAAGEQKLQTSIQIVDGLTYRNTVSVNNGSRVESFALELAPGSEAKPIFVQGDNTIYGNASLNRAITNAQAQGYHVLGGINTDFFIMSTGVPIGIVVENGVYKSSPEGENALLITDNRISVAEAPQVSMSLYNQSNGLSVIPNNFNKTRQQGTNVYLLNEYFSTVSTRGTGAGWYVRMKALPDPVTGKAPDLTVNSSLTLEVTELLISDQPTTIGPDEYILTAADGANRKDAFMAFQVGDRVTLNTSCDNTALSAAQWASGVGDIMVRDGMLTDSANWNYAGDGRQPRSALGIKPDGSVVLYAVDGRQTGHSVGLSQQDLARELLSQGCVTAVNMDGGGSTSLSVWVPGKTGPVIQNKPSDGRARGCATYLLLVTDQRGDGRASRLVPAETGQSVLSGSSLTLPQVSAVDAGLNPVSADLGGLAYTSQNGLGVIQNGVYTAGTAAGTDTLRITAGALTGEAQIHVVNQLTEFKISRAGSGVVLGNLAVRPGEQVQLAVSGSFWGRAALRDFGPVEVTVQGDVGTVDQNGLFTASALPNSGSITFSAGGMSQTVGVSMTNVHTDVPQGHWAYEGVEYCYANNIVSGINSTQFGVGLLITRGDFIQLLYNAIGRPAVTAPCTFTDVTADAYYYSALAWGQQTGLASGGGDGAFHPKDPITREQALTLLYRFLPLAGKTCPDGGLSVLDRFADKGQLSEYARIPTATLVAQGLVAGSGGRLSPGSTVTRGEMALMVYKVLTHTPQENPPEETVDPEQPGAHVLALDQSQVTLASGGSATLKAVLLPAAEGASFAWSSSDPAAAAVTAGGMVTNLHPGKESKTVTVTASWNGLTASCAVVCQPAQHTGTVTNAELGLNVRSGPGTGYGRMGSLKNGAQVVVLGQETGWYQILFLNGDNQAAIGYVSADYLTLNG